MSDFGSSRRRSIKTQHARPQSVHHSMNSNGHAHSRQNGHARSNQAKLNAYSEFKHEHRVNYSRRTFSKAAIAIPFALLVGLGGGGFFFWSKRAVAAEIDGKQVQAPNGASIRELIDKGFASPKFGNLVSVAGDILEQGKGNSFTVSVNGHDLGDAFKDYRLVSGDKITFTNGTDAEEEHQSDKTPIPYSWERAKGAGAIGFVSEWGKPGYSEKVVGNISGIALDRGVVQEPVNRVLSYLNVEPKNGEKLVAITFDDGPSEYTKQLMDILDKKNAKATFFDIGDNIQHNLAICEDAIARGHQVAMHSLHHPDMTKLSDERMIEEIDTTKQMLASKGITTNCLRAPYGAFSKHNWEVLSSRVSSLIGWNLDTLDWKKPGAATIVKNACSNMHPGAIILCHAGGGTREQTVEAVPQIIDQWQAAGYTFVTIKELLATDDRFPKHVLEDSFDGFDEALEAPHGFSQTDQKTKKGTKK